jgi:hypothetical protein
MQRTSYLEDVLRPRDRVVLVVCLAAVVFFVVLRP